MQISGMCIEIIKIGLSVFTCAGVIIAGKNLLFLEKQFLSNYEFAKKNNTINFFNDIKRQSQAVEHELYSNKVVDMDFVNKNNDFYFEIKEYLSLLERFSTGVNIGVFDLEVADRLSGSFFINKFEQLTPFINDIRIKRANKQLYKEFEYMVKILKEKRSESMSTEGNLQHAPSENLYRKKYKFFKQL